EFIEPRVAAVNRRVEDTQKDRVVSGKIDITPSIFFVMIDLDGFKPINDAYGHAAGDQVLMQVRDVLRASCRDSDVIIRWGGDEFLVVGENNNIHAAERLAERIRRNLAEFQYQVGEGHTVTLSGSIGFSMYPFSVHGKADQMSWEQVIAIADDASLHSEKEWPQCLGRRVRYAKEFLGRLRFGQCRSGFSCRQRTYLADHLAGLVERGRGGEAAEEAAEAGCLRETRLNDRTHPRFPVFCIFPARSRA
ncbi:GGDEF domain-containing protein, partial [Thiolapillus sp.]